MCWKRGWLVLLLVGLLAGCGGQAPAPLPQEEATAVVVVGEDQVTGLLTVPYAVGAREFEFLLTLPESWRGTYELAQSDQGTVSFLYTGEPARREAVFTIQAVDEAAWAQRKEQPDAGTAILVEDGVVFVYRIAADNPYQGAPAEQFGGMVASVQEFIGTFSLRPVEEGSGTA